MSIAFLLLAAAKPAIIAAAPDRCQRLTVAVADGQEILPETIEATECVATRPAGVRFDRASGTSRADGDLAAGSYLGRISVAAPAAVARGDALNLVSTAGPVKIIRRVTALQLSRGGRIFVRDADGQVFAATLRLKDAQ